MPSSSVRQTLASTSVLCASLALAACAGKEALLPEDGRTMLEIYQNHVGDAGNPALLEARLALRRPVDDQAIDATAYTRTAQNEIEALFVRLPNPDLVLYVYPHLATGEEVPIPGYSTVFPMYERVIYALPGELP